MYMYDNNIYIYIYIYIYNRLMMHGNSNIKKKYDNMTLSYS